MRGLVRSRQKTQPREQLGSRAHPPTPQKSTAHGAAARSAAMTRAASTSPDGSPAAMNICDACSERALARVRELADAP
jgi:hypothetical protein